MKFQHKIFVLAIVLAIPLVFSDEVITSLGIETNPINQEQKSSFSESGGPGDIAPKIYLVKKTVTVDGFNTFNYREGMYLFTGEILKEKVIVRDLNGVDDIAKVEVIMDGYPESLCREVDSDSGNKKYGQKSHQYYKRYNKPNQENLNDFIPGGFDPLTDKVYECVLTAEQSWYGASEVNIVAYDHDGGSSTGGISQIWFFNPAILINIDTNDGSPTIEFEDGLPGETVMSRNKLIVTNLAEGGVDLYTWISADDLADPVHSGAVCPTSNILEVDIPGMFTGMEYRANKGTFFGNWEDIQNPDLSGECSMTGSPPRCQGATAILDSSVSTLEDSLSNIVRNLQHTEIQFRLTYPLPCVGDFRDGQIHIITRAI